MNKKEMLFLRLEGRTYNYIADKAKLSRQRIQQLLAPPRAIRDFVVKKYKGYCASCGLYVGKSGHVHHENFDSENYDDIENLKLLCISCHRTKHNTQSKCLLCGKPVTNRGDTFCSRECRKKYHTIHGSPYSTALTCSSCGKEFSLIKSQAKARGKRNKSGLAFCSKKCWGKWRRRGQVRARARKASIL